MNIGNCCICLSAFTGMDVAALKECPHTFHYQCIQRAVQTKGECPMCRKSATARDVKRLCIDSPTPDGNYSKYALNNAMEVFDNVSRERGESGEHRQLLQDTLMSLICTIEGEQNGGKAGVIDWTPLKELISDKRKMAGMAILVAVLVWLCWMYWPVLVPLVGRVASSLLGMITRMAGFLKHHFPQTVFMALALVGINVVSEKILEPTVENDE